MRIFFRIIYVAITLTLFWSSVEAATITPPPASSSLVGYWSFNEGTSTNAADYSGNGYTGVFSGISNPSTVTSGWNQGKVGTGITLDGTNDYVDIGQDTALNFLNTDEWSISMWVYPTKASSIYTAISNGPTSGNYGWYLVYDNGTVVNKGVWFDYWAPNAIMRIKTQDNDVPLNQWSYITMVKSPGGVSSAYYKLYVNGVDRTTIVGGTFSPVSITYTTFSTKIGSRVGASFWGGSIDEVRVYNRALTETEIKRLYQSSGRAVISRVNQSGLVGYWRFDEGTSINAFDSSGNGRTIPFTGNISWADGKFGKAVALTGSSADRLDVSGVVGVNPTVISVSAWIKPTGVGGTAGDSIFSHRTGTPLVNFYLQSNSSLRLQMRSSTSGVSEATYSGKNYVSCGCWTHVGMVFNVPANRHEVYVDGVLVATDTTNFAGQDFSATTDYIGLSYSGSFGGTFAGSIDDVRIYDRALNSAEFATIYNTGYVTRKQVSDKDLVGYWSFNEGTSTSVGDFSGNGNLGTLTNMAFPPTSTSGWGTGKLGRGLNFDGVNDYVRGPNTGFPSGTSDRTISAWFKTTAVRGNNQYGAILMYGPGLTNQDVYLLVGTDSTLGTNTCGPSQNGNSVGAGVPVNDGRWHNCVVTFSGGVWSVYLDGVFKNSKVMTTNTTVGSNVTIGATNSSALPFNGAIDEVRVYSRVLSEDEIRTLYNIGR